MQELSQELRGVAEESEQILDVPRHLRETSKKWAGYCLQELDGLLLTKGLAISKAITIYLNEYERGISLIQRGDKK